MEELIMLKRQNSNLLIQVGQLQLYILELEEKNRQLEEQNKQKVSSD